MNALRQLVPRLLRDGWTLPALALSAAALAGAALSLILVLRGIWLSHTAMPFMDQLDYTTAGILRDSLFHRHNEHLIFLPKLGFLLDLRLGGGNAVNIGTILLIQLGHALLLGWMVTAGNREWRRPDVVAFGLALCACFSSLQYENLAWGFQTQFVGVYALATACFAVVFLGGTGLAATLAACLLGAAATLTMANGVFVLPIAAALALLAGRPWRQVAAYAAVSALLLGVFIAGHVSPEHHSSPLDALRVPWRVATYMAVFLGRPLAEMLRHPITADGGGLLSSIVIGGAGMLLAAGLGLRALLWRRALSPVEFALLAGLAFILASAGVTAAGRHGFGYIQATSPRYGTPALLFWCLLLLSFQVILHRRGKLPALAASAALVAAAAALTLQQPRSLLALEHFVAARYPAETALLLGVRDDDAFRAVYPLPEAVEPGMRGLRERNLSIHAGREGEWLGRPIGSLFRLLPEGRCLGVFDRARLQGAAPAPFATVSGWAWDGGRRTRLGRILLVNDAGAVVGFARGPLRRLDVPRATGGAVPDTRVGWTGHALAGPGATLRAYGLAEPGAACPLPGAVTLAE
ncbi:hypothetical protein [Sediminicoccus sp. BL-A-41-H5]|uniref:hypothetical protein n=1 Tax=Sediminicoccus sp. BL-A-41-H5 TaxID=3421106 RepID=UPI003D669371